MTGIMFTNDLPPFVEQPDWLKNMPLHCGIQLPPQDANGEPINYKFVAPLQLPNPFDGYPLPQDTTTTFAPFPFNPLYLDVMKLDPEAQLPTKTHESDAGFDLYALEDVMIEPETIGVVKTGIAIDIPVGYVGLIWPRSGMAVKRKSDVFAGVIDPGYRGDVSVCLYNAKKMLINGDFGCLDIKKGERVGQILIQEIPKFTVREVKELGQSERGEKGFSSSGR